MGKGIGLQFGKIVKYSANFFIQVFWRKFFSKQNSFLLLREINFQIKLLVIGQVQNFSGSGLTLTFDIGLGFNCFLRSKSFRVWVNSFVKNHRVQIRFSCLSGFELNKCPKMYISMIFSLQVLNFFNFREKNFGFG